MAVIINKDTYYRAFCQQLQGKLPTPTARILKVYTEAFPGSGHIYGPDGPTTHCSHKAASLKTASTVGMLDGTHTPWAREQVRRLQSPWSSWKVNRQSTSPNNHELQSKVINLPDASFILLKKAENWGAFFLRFPFLIYTTFKLKVLKRLCFYHPQNCVTLYSPDKLEYISIIGILNNFFKTIWTDG